MVSTLNVVFNFIYMLNSDWPFGQFYCKISNFIAIVSVAASVFTLMAISIDRSVIFIIFGQYIYWYIHWFQNWNMKTETLMIFVWLIIESSNWNKCQIYENLKKRNICWIFWNTIHFVNKISKQKQNSNQKKCIYIYKLLSFSIQWSKRLLEIEISIFIFIENT